MKKIVLSFVLVFISLLSMDAQKIGNLSLELAGSMSMGDSDYGPDKYSFNVVYLFNTSETFKIGLGTGVSYNNVRLNERHSLYQKNVDGTIVEIPNEVPYEARKNAIAIPLFVKMKLVMVPQLALKPYLGVKAGTRFTYLKSISENKINPFVFEAAPALGVDIPVGKHFMGIEVGADLNLGNLDNQYWITKKLISDKNDYNTLFYKNELQKKFTFGLYAALSFTF